MDTSTIFVDSTHVKACANSRKAIKKVAQEQSLWYKESLKAEINQDRNEHGKKPLKEKTISSVDDDSESVPLE